MSSLFSLQLAAGPIRPASSRRLNISRAGRKQSSLAAQQLLEEARETRSQPKEELSHEVPVPAVPALDPAAPSHVIAERQASHLRASTSESDSELDAPSSQPVKKAGRGRPSKKSAAQQSGGPTETVFIGEVPGFGWAEGFIPQFRTEQRPIEPLKKRRGRKKKSELIAEAEMSRDEEEAPEELEIYLIELGVPKSKVQQLMDTAVAWRVTPGGRPLIDRRRQSRLARNVRIVAEYLEIECGVPYGPNGVAAVFLQVPELMLCKPTSNDRWDRRAVELAAYRLKYGHCNVPENWEPNVELGTWVKRQRVARAAGQLSEERLQILERMGFEFGDLAQITEEWEYRFDQLIDWMLWHGENGQTFSWIGVDWGARGGVTARELALWMALQREFRRRQLLPAEAEQRFEALQVEWDAVDETAAALDWIGWLGKLLYVVERRCLDTRRPPPKLFGKRADAEDSPSSSSDDEEAVSASFGAAATVGSARKRSSGPSAGRAMKARIAATMAARREALMKANPTEEPGLGFWVARQRWLWRHGRLLSEQARMLHLAGVDMDVYSPTEWQQIAHIAAELLQGSKIVLGTTEGAIPPPQPPTSSPAAAAMQQHSNGSADATSSMDDPTASGDFSEEPESSELGFGGVLGLGNPQLAVRRWVQTQRAMFAEGRLSPGQLRYLQFLGVSWILSDEVMDMDDAAWIECFAELEKERKVQGIPAPPSAAPSRLQEWLYHQRGLRALGLLQPARCIALGRKNWGWEFERPADADDWDLRLSQLLMQSIAAGTTDVTDENERFEGLKIWLQSQQEAAALGQLPSCRATQLKALGVQIQ